ncbi:MAG: hypothetical protein Q4C77_05710 [Eubacteriales bacterium]|nr:hypothetical protein [Eubacteriales bacterium]
MKNLYLAMTLGADPHTVGIYKAVRIANLLGIPSKILATDMDDEKKIQIIKEEAPVFLGLSYRLSPDKAVYELQKFLKKMENAGLIRDEQFICFAGLLPTLDLVRKLGIDKKYNISLMGSYKDIDRTTSETIDFFRIATSDQRKKIIKMVHDESEPERIKIIDEIAKDVFRNDAYLLEPPLPVPSQKAVLSITDRIDESKIPIIRSHYGVPAPDINPTVDGIRRIAQARAIDELSLGSSDLSQRYYGHPEMFLDRKNDGGVPYKNREDLERIFAASRDGNFPSVKPYCHVNNIIPFIDECLDIGMLKGAHQAIPLFWFNELDGRGPMTVPDSIEEHLRAVQYLAKKGIPVEMNDPNQWSSRMVHDTLFVVSYCLLSSVMYKYGVKNMVVQCQFNKPATTGDYADLAKMMTGQYFIEQLRPAGNRTRVLYECRSGIEHFSTDQELAKFQLARSTILQMLINPSILHLVSYCEADHVATADDVIESSKILRHAVRLFRENEQDIRRAVKWDVVQKRSDFLKEEVRVVLDELVALSGHRKITNLREYHQYLGQAKTLQGAMQYGIMAAPGITHKKYAHPELLTKIGEYGVMDCYRNWDDNNPMREKERLADIRKKYNLKY